MFWRDLIEAAGTCPRSAWLSRAYDWARRTSSKAGNSQGTAKEAGRKALAEARALFEKLHKKHMDID